MKKSPEIENAREQGRGEGAGFAILAVLAFVFIMAAVDTKLDISSIVRDNERIQKTLSDGVRCKP